MKRKSKSVESVAAELVGAERVKSHCSKRRQVQAREAEPCLCTKNKKKERVTGHCVCVRKGGNDSSGRTAASWAQPFGGRAVPWRGMLGYKKR